VNTDVSEDYAPSSKYGYNAARLYVPSGYITSSHSHHTYFTLKMVVALSSMSAPITTLHGVPNQKTTDPIFVRYFILDEVNQTDVLM
jgi:hypothetical protein